MSRIQLTDTTLDVVMKMAEGNPGAANVLSELLKQGRQIDPDSFCGGLATIMDFDTNGIYGCKIWVLYKDVCGQSIRRVMLLSRAAQLGFFSSSRIAAMASDETRRAGLTTEEWADIDAKVCARLEAFAKPETLAA